MTRTSQTEADTPLWAWRVELLYVLEDAIRAMKEAGIARELVECVVFGVYMCGGQVLRGKVPKDKAQVLRLMDEVRRRANALQQAESSK